ncbi:NF038132 family protein [Dechloromonas sp. A34]|uniref:NF038132 family protein n=1 Tax=Dechloromonas sp. A34 TaxID=447588 RepID=UPI0022492346|nr:NF038132 family protein [Dechloromonas sp. A34]
MLSLSALAFSGTASALPAGWSCTGTCGELGADGVVTASPDGGNYLYVATTNAPSQAGLGLGSETNGTVLRSVNFAATAGTSLQYHFNFVTTDGAGFADYAWSRLFNAADNSLVALLFTARTTPGGNTVPGFGMPAIAATMDPTTVTVVPGAPTWSPVGTGCWATGCGYTGWVKSTYQILADGNYYLDFGVVNWSDTAFNTGLAIDGILVGGNPIDPNQVPEPASLALLSLGLLGLGALRRRKAS